MTKTPGDMPLDAGAVTVPVADAGARARGAPDLRGDSLVGHFFIIRRIGRGGMGEVFLARDTRLGRLVALKLVHPERLGSRVTADELLAEARTTARFNHPNIVTIHHVGQHEGTPYLALEYVDGQSLRLRMTGQRVEPMEALRVGHAVAQGLVAAHGAGVLHRDLKPENILLGRDGRVRIVDFGLARLFRVPGDGEGGPSSFRLAGTPAYMAPEQWLEAECSGATDVWAVGVILFELLAARLPYEETRLPRLSLAVTDPAPAPRLEDSCSGVELPDGLGDLVARCMEKEAGARPSALELDRALAELLHPRTRASGSGASPFRGLLPFTEEQAGLFFGRERETAAVVERLRLHPLVTVVGPSGAGKSSLVYAGVVPRLRERGPLQVLGVRPGPRPMEALGAAVARAWTRSCSSVRSDEVPPELQDLVARLRREPHQLSLLLHRLAERGRCQVLLAVDQLEELTIQVEDVAERRSFLAAVCGAVGDHQEPVRVVLACRDDHLGRLSEAMPAGLGFGQLMVLGRPGRRALQEMLTRPVELSGCRFEDDALVDEMIAAAGEDPAALPLLQFTARQLWDRRQGSVLERAVHEQMGGVAGALASHADTILKGFSPAQHEAARQLLLRLVTPEGNRRTVARDELLEGAGEEHGAEVLRQLVDARLLTVRGQAGDSGARVELAHESLVRGWDTLERMLEESRDEHLALTEMEQAARLWDRRGRPAREVWQGGALKKAEAAAALRSHSARRVAAVRASRRGPAAAATPAAGGLVAAGARHGRRRRGRVGPHHHRQGARRPDPAAPGRAAPGRGAPPGRAGTVRTRPVRRGPGPAAQLPGGGRRSAQPQAVARAPAPGTGVVAGPRHAPEPGSQPRRPLARSGGQEQAGLRALPAYAGPAPGGFGAGWRRHGVQPGQQTSGREPPQRRPAYLGAGRQDGGPPALPQVAPSVAAPL